MRPSHGFNPPAAFASVRASASSSLQSAAKTSGDAYSAPRIAGMRNVSVKNNSGGGAISATPPPSADSGACAIAAR